MLDNNLKSKVNKLWDRFWSGGISNPLVAIEQISYLIFMKRLEDEDVERVQNAQLTGESYTSIFDECDDCRWSKWTQMPADSILQHVREKVFPFLRELGEEGSLYREYMDDAIFSIPNASLLIEAVHIINDMHIKEQNRDTKGDLYEYLLSELQTAGKNGQFRTPRHIIEMIVELTEPKPGDRILDPACGTAGFLVSAYEYILKQNTSKDLIKKDEDGNEYGFHGDKLTDQQWRILRESTLYGYDIDRTMTRISMMNLMMHGITRPNVERLNTLSTRYDQRAAYDVILANPPFKGSIDASELSGEFQIVTKKTEILFVELIYNGLTQGGRAGVIVPDGVLFGKSKAHIKLRKLLLEECRLDAVISMPSGVFKPYAGVSTGVLVFTKGEPTEHVWFYEMKSDGFTLDDKRTFIDGKGDIPDILAKFAQRSEQDFTDRKARCFVVPIAEIKESDYDLSVSRYKEFEYEEVTYEKPEVLKKRILETEKEIMNLIEGLDV